MSTTSVRRRYMRTVLNGVLGMVLIAVMLQPVEAQAYVGGAVSESSGPDGRSVSGAGTFVFHGATGSTAAVTLECSVHAKPALEVVSTYVAAPDEEGCILYKGTAVVAEAPGSARNLPAWATTTTTNVDLTIPGAFLVCWNVGARFDDASRLTSNDCGAAVVPSNVRQIEVVVEAHEEGGLWIVSCTAVASPDALVTSVRECGLAPAVTVPGGVATTGDAYFVTPGPDSLLPLGSAAICYRADSAFADGSYVERTGCT